MSAAGAASTPSLIELSGIGKTYANGTVALTGVDAAVREGGFVSLVGPSGCGKSTLLRIIAGLIAEDRGRLDWPASGARPADIGFVFQDATLMPWASVADNVYLPLKLKGVGRAEAGPRIAEALSRVGLSDFAAAFPRELSGGMKMRVSIARALITRPKLLLMDEPFAALDEITRQKLNDDVRRLWRQSGITVIFVTHSVYEATYLSSRIVVMRARPGEVYADLTLPESGDRDVHYRSSDEFAASSALVSRTLQEAIYVGGGDHE